MKSKRAVALADQLIRATNGDDRAGVLAARLRHMLQPPMPMKEILARVPGETNIERARNARISKQTYLNWINGTARPHPKKAAFLARLTGIPVDVIRGR